MHHHRIETPMPRSAQIRAAQMAAAGADPAFAAAAVPTPLATHRSRRNATGIDYGKYKTKLCRNFLMGVACPFESRCVFAHGELEAQQAASSLSGSAENSMNFERQPQSTTSAYSGAMEFPTPMYPGTATPPSSDDEAAMLGMQSAAGSAAPPSYEVFIMTQMQQQMVLEPASPLESDPDTPPRPRRHNPYDPCVFGYTYVTAY